MILATLRNRMPGVELFTPVLYSRSFWPSNWPGPERILLGLLLGVPVMAPAKPFRRLFAWQPSLEQGFGIEAPAMLALVGFGDWGVAQRRPDAPQHPVSLLDGSEGLLMEAERGSVGRFYGIRCRSGAFGFFFAGASASRLRPGMASGTSRTAAAWLWSSFCPWAETWPLYPVEARAGQVRAVLRPARARSIPGTSRAFRCTYAIPVCRAGRTSISCCARPIVSPLKTFLKNSLA